MQVSDLTPILLVVVLLGAGTDYGLFLIFRIREELRRGREVHDAVSFSLCKVGESITFSGLTVIGALADSVEEVVDLEPDQIQPAPRIGTQIRTDFIKGMGKRDAQFIMILDIDRVFSDEELSAAKEGSTLAEAVV